MLSREITSSIKSFMKKAEKGFGTEAKLDRGVYELARQIGVYYNRGQVSKKTEEKLKEYKAYKSGKTKEDKADKLEQMVIKEMDIGNVRDEEKEDQTYETVISLLDGDNPLEFSIDEQIKQRILNSKTKSGRIEAINELVSDICYSCENWKSNEDMRDYKLKYNSISLKEIVDFSNLAIEEKVNYILGNNQNIQNKRVRDLTYKSIIKSATYVLSADESVNKDLKKKEREEQLPKNKEIRTKILTDQNEALRKISDEEKSEKTIIIENGISYEISKQEELIAQYPETLDAFPGLKYKFNEDGTKKTPLEEVRYGLNIIEQLKERYDVENGNKEALDSKINQVYDLINEDFVYSLSQKNTKLEGYMKYFITSMGVNEAREYLRQVQDWQQRKETEISNEELEIENSLEDSRKKVYVDTDEKKAEEFLNTAGEKLLRALPNRKLQITFINRDTLENGKPTITAPKDIEENLDFKVELQDYIDSAEYYDISDEEVEEYANEEKKDQQYVKDNAAKLYRDRKEKVIKENPEYADREKEVIEDIIEESKKNREREAQEEKEEKEEKEKAQKEKELEKENKKQDEKQYTIEDIIEDEPEKEVEEPVEEEIQEEPEEKYPEEDILIEDEEPEIDIEIKDENKKTITGAKTIKLEKKEPEVEIEEENKKTITGARTMNLENKEKVEEPQYATRQTEVGENYTVIESDEPVQEKQVKTEEKRVKRELVDGEQIDVDEVLTAENEVYKNVKIGDNYILNRYKNTKEVEVKKDEVKRPQTKEGKYEEQIDIENLKDIQMEEELDRKIKENYEFIQKNKAYVNKTFRDAPSQEKPLEYVSKKIDDLDSYEKSELKEKTDALEEKLRLYKSLPPEDRRQFLEKNKEVREYYSEMYTSNKVVDLRDYKNTLEYKILPKKMEAKEDVEKLDKEVKSAREEIEKRLGGKTIG